MPSTLGIPEVVVREDSTSIKVSMEQDELIEILLPFLGSSL